MQKIDWKPFILLSRIIALTLVSYLFPRKKKIINRRLITGVSNQGKNPRSRWKPLCNNVEDEKVARYATPSNEGRGNTRDKEFHGEPNLRCVYARETKMAIVISLRLIHVNYDRDAAKKGRHWMKNCFLATGHSLFFFFFRYINPL